MRASIMLLGVVWALVVVTGCADADAPPGDGDAAADGGGAPSIDTPSRDGCPDWAQDLTYGEGAGLSASDASGAVVARVIDASDVPARRGQNTWRLRLEDADGAPLEGQLIRWACAFNPDHVHGFAPMLEAGSAPGVAEVSDLRLWVEGGWEVRLWIDAVDSGKEPYRPVTPCAPLDEPSRPHDITLRVCVPLS